MRLAAKKSYPIVTDLKPGNTPPQNHLKKLMISQENPLGTARPQMKKTAASHGFPFILLKGLY